MPPPFWILWLVCQHCCLHRVLKRVHVLCLVLPCRTFPLLQGLASPSRERTLQHARYRPLFTGSHSSRNRLQISSPFTGSLSLVIILSARSFVCIVNMNASCFTRFFRASLIPGKDNSSNGFASTFESSAQSFSSTASVSGSFPILRSTGFPLYS